MAQQMGRGAAPAARELGPIRRPARPTFGGHHQENNFWAAALTALGVKDPVVETRSTCVDSKRQWRHARNVWHNSMVRSVLQTLAAPFGRRQGGA